MLLRRKCPSYGFGRPQLLPLVSTGEAAGKYLAKYIAKESLMREDHPEYKGCRFTRYSRGTWRTANTCFAWNNQRGREWRQKLGQLAKECGFRDMRSFKWRFGPHWAWLLQDVILAVNLEPATSPK